MLNDEHDQAVERMQAQALKCIYGYKDSYATMREKAGVTTHKARRITLCDAFAEKAARNPGSSRGSHFGLAGQEDTGMNTRSSTPGQADCITRRSTITVGS